MLNSLVKRQKNLMNKERKLLKCEKPTRQSIMCPKHMMTPLFDDDYVDISQTVSGMEKCKTFALKPELVVLVHIIKRPIAVHYEDAAGQKLFGEAYQDSAESSHLLNYPDSDNSSGHCDLLLTEERREGQLKDLHNAGRYVIIRVGKQ